MLDWDRQCLFMRRPFSILMRQSSIGREYLRIQSDGVSLTDPEAFHARIQEEKRTFIQTRLQGIDSDFPAVVNGHRGQTAGIAKKRSKKDALVRLSKLWSPFDKRLGLAGIRTGQDVGGNYTIAKSPTAQLDALRTAWAPTFDKKHVDIEGSKVFLDAYARPLDFSVSRPPGVQDYVNFLERAKHSAPGIDGLPYGAWRRAGPCGAQTLFGIGQYMMAGSTMPIGFNDSSTAFPPNGDDELDAVEVSRAAVDTRPLSLKK